MPRQQIAQLKQLRGPQPGQIYRLCQDLITIGSGSRNDIILHDNDVSREHCRLLRVLDDYELRDLGTRSGTFVNGQRVDESGWMLSAVCLIEIGDAITLEYRPLLPDGGPVADDDSPIERYALVVKHQSQTEAEMYPLADLTTLGRDIHNDIVLDEPEISRRHLQITCTSEGYLLEDLGALNGVHINGQRVNQQHLLKPDDRITIGTRVTMWLAPMPPSPSMPAPSPSSGLHQKYKESTLIEGGHPRPGELQGRVFMAYADADWETIVRPMFAYLQRHALPVWVAHGIMPDSPEWEQSIEQAQREANCLLAIITRLSLRTPHVMRSIRYFIAREKPIVLVQYEDAGPLPVYAQGLSMLAYNPAESNRIYQNITQRIKSARGKH